MKSLYLAGAVLLAMVAPATAQTCIDTGVFTTCSDGSSIFRGGGFTQYSDPYGNHATVFGPNRQLPPAYLPQPRYEPRPLYDADDDLSLFDPRRCVIC